MTSAFRVAFAGPSLTDTARRVAVGEGFDLRSPACRGDIAAISCGVPGVLVIIDGYFQQRLAVGHAEIRDAVKRGWQVWGLGSIGAVRAYELRFDGMKGYGTVFGHFLAERDFQDDEVALLHAPIAPFTALSEPLVHIRHALASLVLSQCISRALAESVVSGLKAMWFGDRTTELVWSLLCERREPALTREAFDEAVLGSRVKHTDVEQFFLNRPWELDPPLAARPSPFSAPSAGFS